jgi:AhpC/TSA family
MRKLAVYSLLGCLSLLASACNSDTDVESGDTEVEAPPFPEGQGQAPNASAVYPAGPYGINPGSIVSNFKFVGFPTPDQGTDAAFNVSLSDFYNPTGTDVFPEGSPYGAGEPKPKALMVIVSAVWCGPCNQEADQILPGKYDEYQPKGVEFLLNLADGPTQGIPAEFKHLKNWVKKYETRFPAVVDPSYKLSALFQQNAFPANMLIDTRTMEIVESIAGAPDAAFYAKVDKLVAE